MPTGATRYPSHLRQTPSGPTPPSRPDAARRLRRNRAVATGLLVALGVVAVVTHLVPDPGLATLMARATAEASLVGGLADWFAVTALFRRPLGLPIPHTAIIPNNQDRIGRALGTFLEQNFLTQATLLRKLGEVRIGHRLAVWLSAPDAANLVAETITAALPPLVHSLSHRDLHEFLQRTLGQQLRHADLAPVLGSAIRVLTTSGEADELLERVADVAMDWIEENRSRIDQLVAEHSRWWIPKAINRRVAQAIVTGVLELLEDLQEPGNEVRQKFREALDELVTELLTSPERKAQIAAAKRRIFEHPDVQIWLAAVGRDLSQAVVADLKQPNSRTRLVLIDTIRLIGEALANDPALQQYVDRAMEYLAARVVSWRSEIGGFFSDVVRSWDAQILSERLEFTVGSDLQYIRINGTIVGGIIGCVIFILQHILS